MAHKEDKMLGINLITDPETGVYLYDAGERYENGKLVNTYRSDIIPANRYRPAYYSYGLNIVDKDVQLYLGVRSNYQKGQSNVKDLEHLDFNYDREEEITLAKGMHHVVYSLELEGKAQRKDYMDVISRLIKRFFVGKFPDKLPEDTPQEVDFGFKARDMIERWQKLKGKYAHLEPDEAEHYQRADETEIPEPVPYVRAKAIPVENMIALAQMLLDDPERRKVFERVGIHGDLTEEEDKTFDGLVLQWIDEKGWGPYHHTDVLFPLPLARRLAAGFFEEPDRGDVKGFVLHNLSLKSDNTYHHPPPNVGEVRLFTKLALSDPKICSIYREMVAEGEDVGRRDPYLNQFKDSFKKKYGLLTTRNLFYTLSWEKARGEIEAFDEEKFEALIKARIKYDEDSPLNKISHLKDSVCTITCEGISNV